MFQFLVGFAKRFAVLVPGIIIAYFSFYKIFPAFDKKLPLALAILATYALGAYVLVPALIRVGRIFYPANHLPLYCVTPDGFASDPLNVGVIATRRQLITVMEKAGWYTADPRTLGHMIKQVVYFSLGRDYPTAPVSNLYLFGRKQDLAFEIPVSGSQRHHVRFWATTYKVGRRLSFKSIHWHHRRAHIQGDDLLWVGAASLDTGLAPIRHNMQITHMIDPDTNRERDLLINHLKAAKVVRKTQKIKLGDPYRLVNRVWRGSLQTDGVMTVAHLKE